MRRFRLLVVAILLALALGPVAVKPQQHQNIEQPDTSTSGAAKQHQITKSFREGLSIIWDRTWDDPVAFYTFVLSIFTGLLFIVSATQIAFLIRAERITRKSAEAAKTAADAAIQTAQNSEKLLSNLEVPYVYPANIKMSTMMDIRDDATRYGAMISVSFKNFGRSPAVLKDAYLKFMVHPTKTSTPIYTSSDIPLRVQGVLGDRETSAPISVTPKDLHAHIERIINGEIVLRLAIRVAWHDLIGSTHTMGQWFIWDRRGEKFVPGGQLRDEDNQREEY